jgi:Tfp pilus assembly protein PilF
MRSRAVRWLLISAAAVSLAACTESVHKKKDPLAKSVIDEADLNDLMLTARDPNAAVDYFQKALAREPDRADFRRGLASSLARAGRYPESARVYQELVTLNQDEPTDRLDYAFVAMRLDEWDTVKTLSRSFPAGLATPRRYLIDAMVADQDENWEAADKAYARAVKLSPQPGAVLNNWGVSQMSRGDLAAAEATFQRALSYDGRLFNAKNNLGIARALRGEYSLPLVPLTDEEKAVLLNNMGIVAMRRGDEKVARGLFAAAVDAHPQYYAGAASKLAALEANVEN